MRTVEVRLPEDLVRKVEALSRLESESRSGMIRKLLSSGYRDFLIRRAARRYAEGLETFSEAAENAEVSVWEMHRHLARSGFESEYSVEDLEREAKLLGNSRF